MRAFLNGYRRIFRHEWDPELRRLVNPVTVSSLSLPSGIGVVGVLTSVLKYGWNRRVKGTDRRVGSKIYRLRIRTWILIRII